jgi:hypothetical protein
MSELWDKLKSELDRAGKVAQDALDEGKLRIELFRTRQAADRNAQALGYAVYRAGKEGREPDPESHSRLIKAMAEQDAEMARLESDLRKAEGESASPVPATPPSAENPPGEG